MAVGSRRSAPSPAAATPLGLGEEVRLAPPHAVLWADQVLEIPERKPRGAGEVVVEGGRAAVGVNDGHRCPGRAGHIRRGVRREVARIDGDGKAMVLEESRGGQSHGATAEDRGVAIGSGERMLERQMRGPPGEGHATAPVAIIVDEGLVTQALDADIKPGTPERPESHDVTDHTLRRDKDLGQSASLHPGRRPRMGPQRRARAEKRRSAKLTASHFRTVRRE